MTTFNKTKAELTRRPLASEALAQAERELSNTPAGRYVVRLLKTKAKAAEARDARRKRERVVKVPGKDKPKRYSVLVKDMDYAFKRSVRLEAALKTGGVVACVSCGRPYHWKDLDGGHFISAGKLAVRWHRKNVHPQCTTCNKHLQSNEIEYEKAIVRMYGPAMPELLRQRSRSRMADQEVKIALPTLYVRQAAVLVILEAQAREMGIL